MAEKTNEKEKVKVKATKSKTLQKRNSLRVAKYSLKIGSFAMPLIPFSIIVGVNANDWFATTDGFSIGMGLAMLLVSTLITYLVAAKKTKIFEGFSGFWSACIIIVCWGVCLLFLGTIINELGSMLLYVGLSLLASAIMDETESRVVEEKLEFYNELVSANNLDKKEVAKKKEKEQAEKLAKEEGKKVDLL